MTDQLASVSFLAGLILSFAARSKEKFGTLIVLSGMASGLVLGAAVFGVRLTDPRGMNLLLTRFNRWVIVIIAAAAALAFLRVLFSMLLRRVRGARGGLPDTVLTAALLGVALMYLAPTVIQFTREFVYFGESGLSTKALLRAVGFTLGLVLCLLLALSSFKVHRALSDAEAPAFLLLSLLVFFVEYGFNAVAALQRLKIIPLSDLVFEIMVWGDEYKNCFLFAQLLLGLVMLLRVAVVHRRPRGEFANRAQLRKEKARLRSCRRWSWSLLVWALTAALTVTALHYYDTKPPEEVRPEAYDLSDGIISIDLEKVSDGHLHKFSYVTPHGYDVRFLVVKKPVGTAYGVGLDACEICGVAGYFERGDEVICRRCDVVMNKNTIGFKGGCNPIPFPYEVVKGKIFIDVRELERHERRFR